MGQGRVVRLLEKASKLIGPRNLHGDWRRFGSSIATMRFGRHWISTSPATEQLSGFLGLSKSLNPKKPPALASKLPRGIAVAPPVTDLRTCQIAF